MESNRTWNIHYKNIEGHAPRNGLIEAMEYISARESALDLGAGVLQDSKYLLEQGFMEVVAVDSEPTVAERNPKDERLRLVISTFEDFDFPVKKFDLINAQFSLPYTHPQEFERVFNLVKGSLKDGGVFVGHLFGNQDEWNQDQDMTFLDKETITKLCADMEIIKLLEEEGIAKTASGNDKYWHLFHLILRKK